MLILGIVIGGVGGIFAGFAFGVNFAMDFVDNCEKDKLNIKDHESGRN